MEATPALRSLFGPLLVVLGGALPDPRPAGDGEALRELRIELRSGDKWVRQGAVEGLVRLGTPEAWEVVIDALHDVTGEVADTAEVHLARLPSRELVERLLGRDGISARDEWVRRRVVELLGRLELGLDARVLVPALADPDADVRRLALLSLRRLVDAGRLAGDVERDVLPALRRRVARERDPHVRARALATLAHLAPHEAGAAAREAVRDRAPALRCAAAELAPGILPAEEAVRTCALLGADPVLAVRTQAVDSLAGLGNRPGVRALVERLETEEEARLALRLVDHLQALSGLRYRRDPRPWRDWAARLPEDWRPAPTDPATGGEERGRGAAATSSVTFAGLPILSRRLVFLIDLSGSIWREREGAPTKKEAIDERLRSVLSALPPDTRFNVIPFTGEPHPWRERIVPATRKNVRAAIRDFERCRRSGSGNFWDAALLAFEDPDVDTLVVLTDGAPTGGRRHRLELIVPLLLDRNATRKVAIDAILVDAPRGLEEPWRVLAEGSGGRMVTVEL